MNENIVDKVTQGEYKYGFVTDVETDFIQKGLSEEVMYEQRDVP